MDKNQPTSDLSAAAKRAVLARLLQQRATRPEGESGPLSFAQERLWYFDQLTPGSAAYNIHTAIGLKGPLHVRALELTIQDIVRRHEVLRAVFPTVGGVPTQTVNAPAWTLEIDEVALVADRDAELGRLSLEQAERPFDLARGPLLRVKLLRLAADDHVLLVTMHHIVADGWSVGVFLRELTTVYEAFSRNAPSPLPPLSSQYAHFARAQRQASAGPRFAEQLAYWKERLAGAPAAFDLPTDRPRPRVQSYRGGAVTTRLPEELVDRLRKLARHEGATLFMALLAAFQGLLSRRSGQDDLVVGTPVSGRTGAETEPLIGCFINTLVIRTDLSGNPSFRDVLSRVREGALGAFAHADLPFDKLVEELHPERDLARNPIYQVMFNLLTLGNAPVPSIPSLEVRFLPPGDEASKLDLTLYASEEADGLQLRLVYAIDLFERAGMAEMLAQFKQFLEQVSADPDRPIAEASLVTDGARGRLPDPSAALEERAIEPVTATFAAQARNCPEHPALVESGSVCTYGELAAKMDAIARGLVALAVRPGDVVALTGAPGVSMIAGVLGIMRARGVLLLLDPRLPIERRRLMLREAGVQHLLLTVTGTEAQALAASLGVDSCIEATHLMSAEEDETGTARQVLPDPRPEDAAYLFFTSGTTGIPNGVLGVHKGLAHFVGWQRETFGVGRSDRVAQLTGLSFDVVLREIFLPLTAGATLCLRPLEAFDDLAADRVLPWLEREGVTTIHTVPTLAQTWLDAVPEGVALPSLQRVFFAGEPLTGRLVRRWRSAFQSSPTIINLYGPTETTLAKCFFQVPVEVGDGVQPVGRPLPETQALVLTRARTLCGVGERGEIAIRTPYRTLGYRHAPEEQRKRFVRNRWREDGNDLLYLTGDQGRYRLDGVLEILGRLDDQVKVHGVRVELDEVATVLLQYPGVRQAVAVVRQDTAGGARLLAYVVLAETAAASTGELREFLVRRLPEAAVPSAIVVLGALPVTPNGKLDRRALPEPPVEPGDAVAAAVGPRNPVEEKVAEVWRELIGRPVRSVDDSFFAAGGHSLQATQLVSRLRAAFGIDLSLRDFYEAPTVAGLARLIGAVVRQGAAGADRIPPIGDAASPLALVQRRIWFLEQVEPDTALYIISGALRLRGALNLAAFERAIGDLFVRHAALRITFAEADGEPVQIVGPAVPGIEQHDLRDLDATIRQSEAERLAVAAARPFDLTRGPLIRVTLIQLADEEHLLVVAVHHIVSDVWSIGILFAELGALYDAFVHGRAPQLPETLVQYRDFAAWQRRVMASGALDSQMNYWKNQLGGELPVLELPTDHPRPAVLTHRGARFDFEWSSDVTAALKQVSRALDISLFTTLVSAFALLLSRYARQTDVLIGFPIAGRARPELESLVGCFVNTLALRVDLSGNPTTRELLSRVGSAALGAYVHQDVPFDRLVEELRPPRHTNRHPVFQVGFALHNGPFPTPQLVGLDIHPVSVPVDRARFDLQVSMWESGKKLVGMFEYSTELFEPATAERLGRHFERLTTAAAAGLDVRVSELPIGTDDERRELLGVWNATSVPLAGEQLVQALFEAAVDRDPAALAVAGGGEQLTYAVLDERANQLAHYLRAAGVGPERLVGVCVERSPSLLVAILGVLKAGGAYLSLDPAYPPERVQFMLADSGATIVLTQEHLLAVVVSAGVRAVCLDRDAAAIGKNSSRRPGVAVRGANLAYAIYTSGSTGRPKGVQIAHQGLLNLARWHQRVHGVTAADRATQLAGLGFDASVWELWPYLISGASIHMPDDVSRLLPSALIAWLAAQRISISFLPTPLLEAALNEKWPPHRLRRVLTGGDLLHRGAPAELNFELFNHYGPTENAVVTTWGRAPEGDGPPSIGRPIDNTEVYLLDDQLCPVPVGVPGELHIAGVGLSRGYLGRPDLTAERFIPNPFSAHPGGRLYKTGDFARYRSDGTLAFVGRVDAQVKLRGYRIELAEIEVVLVGHPQVREAVVVLSQAEAEPRLLAYYTTLTSEPPSSGELRRFLRQALPEYMVPAAFVPVVALPLTANGKVDRAGLSTAVPLVAAAAAAAPQTDLERTIAEVWRAALDLEAVGIHDNFFDLGGHSLLLVKVHRRLIEVLRRDVSVVDLFQYPTISALAQHLAVDDDADPGVPVADDSPATRTEDAVAIVGMAARFPGANTVGEFWANLTGGVESISFFSDAELLAEGIGADELRRPGYVKARAVIARPEEFDAGFFGYNPREAALIDPQQRIFLECAWEALEDAGIDPDRAGGPIGVYAGVGLNTYAARVLSDPELADTVSGIQFALSSDKDFLSTRVSYKLNLRGPSVNVQTACSTSLVAVHLACRGLIDRDCDSALAGGVRIAVPQKSGYLFQAGSILSPDGRCRPFDAGAAGTVSGNGAGVVVLKRLRDAVAAGDYIYAVIKGTAINNDGSRKVGYTAPSVDGQAEVIRRAQARAGVEPGSIGYVEAHGTGTDLGDPVEIAALTKAFRAGTPAVGFCALGSLKSNVGHMDAAAGVAGLIKTALTLRHGAVPASLHFERPNPAFDIDQSPFVINTRLREWPASDSPRRAGVSSFGLGGTNAHAVLEEAPPATPSARARKSQLFVLSARSAEALETAAINLAAKLEAEPALNLADVAYTLQVGRRRFDHRWTAVCTSRSAAVAALRTRAASDAVSADRSGARPALTFMFSGQGSQHLNMMRGLYEAEPAFREHLDACAEVVPDLGRDLRSVLYPAADDAEAPAVLGTTAFTQPALFAVEYALARLWQSWGIIPDAMIGHSIGEYVAACLSGVLTLEEAMRLVAVRGRLMQAIAPGAMLAVPLGETALASRLEGQAVAIAAVNGRSSSVASGTFAAIDRLERSLAAEGVACQRLRTSHAFHSAMMEPALDAFRDAVRPVRLNEPRIPYVSNLTGTWMTGADATDPGYWVRHLRGTVRFHDGLMTALQRPGCVLLEVGPGQTLTALARGAARAAGVETIASFRRSEPAEHDQTAIMSALGRLWAAGADVDWAAVHAGHGRLRVPQLPTYPFQRQRYWLGGAPVATRSERRLPVDRWFYSPSWTSALPAGRPALKDLRDGVWLVLADVTATGDAIVQHLREQGAIVVRVLPGPSFSRRGQNEYQMRIASADDYDALVSGLRLAGTDLRRIINCWSIESATDLVIDAGIAVNDRLDGAFYSSFFLAQALGRHYAGAPLSLAVLSRGAHDVTGQESIDPAGVMAMWPVRALWLEYPNLSSVALDIDAVRTEAPAREADLVIREIVAASDERVVAFRAGRRWVQVFRPLAIGAASEDAIRLRDRGVYLIAGGTGGVGLEIARHLASRVNARLALVSRSATIPRDEWPSWIATHGDDDHGSRVIKQIESLEALGADVLIVQADVADPAQMRAAIDRTIDRFGALHGVHLAAGAEKHARSIEESTREHCERELGSRLRAVEAIDCALAARQLDFCVLHSSLAAVLGAAGFAAYSAAHLYLDAFAARRNRRATTPWIAIDWDNWTTWKTAGGPSRADLGQRMSAAEALEALDLIVAQTTAGHVVVSTSDLQTRLDATVRSGRENRGGSAVSAAHQRPALDTAYVAPRTDAERALAGIWQTLLGITPVGIDDNFFELGGDSVIGIQLVSRAGAEGLRLTTREIFAHPTVAGLAAAARVTAVAAADQSIVTGPVPLTPIQRWFFEREWARPAHFSQSRLLEVRAAIDPATLERALFHIAEHHDALRLRYRHDAGNWSQTLAGGEARPSFRTEDLSKAPAGQHGAIIEAAADRLYASFDLADGPLFGAVLFSAAAGQTSRLLIAAHHLLVDATSWLTIVEDLESAAASLVAGAAPRLPRKTTSFKRWAEQLQQAAVGPETAAQAGFWTTLASSPGVVLPRDADGPNLEASSEAIEVRLSSDETDALVLRLPERGGSAAHALLAAVAGACLEWAGGPALRIDVEGFGREPIVPDADVSRTVGWFTAVYPVLIAFDASAPAADQLRAVESQLGTVPDGGIGYGLLRYLATGDISQRLAAAPPAEVSFLYLGGRQIAGPGASMFAPASEPAGSPRSGSERRPYLFDIAAFVVDGVLRVRWTFSRTIHRDATIRRLADEFARRLRAIIRGTSQPVAPPAEVSAASFPGARLNDKQLASLLASLGRGATS